MMDNQNSPYGQGQWPGLRSFPSEAETARHIEERLTTILERIEARLARIEEVLADHSHTEPT